LISRCLPQNLHKSLTCVTLLTTNRKHDTRLLLDLCFSTVDAVLLHTIKMSFKNDLSVGPSLTANTSSSNDLSAEPSLTANTSSSNNLSAGPSLAAKATQSMQTSELSEESNSMAMIPFDDSQSPRTDRGIVNSMAFVFYDPQRLHELLRENEALEAARDEDQDRLAVVVWQPLPSPRVRRFIGPRGLIVSIQGGSVPKYPLTLPAAGPRPTIRTSFTLLPNLPIELRRKIWEFAAHIPRIIEVEFDQAYANHYYGHQDGRICIPCRRPPTVLHICREARAEGLKFYQLLEASWLGADGQRALSSSYEDSRDNSDDDSIGDSEYGSEESEHDSGDSNDDSEDDSQEESEVEFEGISDEGSEDDSQDGSEVESADTSGKGSVDEHRTNSEDSEDLTAATPHIYYNPDADIIYFGLNTCEGTLNSFLRANRNIPRIAISLEEHPDHYYAVGCVVSLAFVAPLPLLPLEPEHHRIARMIRILHGFKVRPCGTHDRKYRPGCVGLREVIWVVNATLLQREIDDSCQLNINDSMRLVLVDDKDLAYHCPGHEEVRLVKKAVDDLEAGRWQALIGQNRWTGLKKPSMSFQRFGLQPFSSRKADQWFLRLRNRSEDIWTPVFKARGTEGCGQLMVFPGQFEGVGDYCVTFVGSEEEIYKAKMVVREEFAKSGRFIGSDNPLSEDPAEAVLPCL
jgi:hypothetical protein